MFMFIYPIIILLFPLLQSFDHAQQTYWDSVKSEWEKEKQQILSVLTESNDEMLDISLPVAEVCYSNQLQIAYVLTFVS